jgi:hypothetical protein
MNTNQPKTHSHNITAEQRLAFIDAIAGGVPFREALVLSGIAEPLSPVAETELEEIVRTVGIFDEVRQSIIPRREGLERIIAELSVSTPVVASSTSVPSPFTPSFLMAPRDKNAILSRFLLPVGAPLFAFLVVTTILLSADHNVPVLSPSSLSVVPMSATSNDGAAPELAMMRTAPASDAPMAMKAVEPMMMAMTAAPLPSLDTVDGVEEFVLREADMELAIADQDIALAPSHTSNKDLLDKLSSAYDAIDR